ncbi:lysozyme [Aeromonas phage 4_D05]|uniref:Lysozyme n=1 Tax=Aeromonas phage 4_D05 TaxID=2588099 RepID=A0A514TUC0_9CAUD|nr:lysozyme [Aeromonas phage 4_D05]QDJ96115.1 lysozyme [Aeromonas phage 4_D05]
MQLLTAAQRCAAIIEYAINPAMALLPPKMTSDKATVMLLAIGLQESRLTHRKQIGGPAKSFLQFESGGGVKGIMSHSASSAPAQALCQALAVPFDRAPIFQAMEFNDALAFGLGRLLLYTDPKALPEIGDAQAAWDLYQRVWRPGKPHRQTWDELYAVACKVVTA